MQLFNASILVIGVYMPTTDSHTEIYLSDIEKLINTHSHGPIVMAGDFNAHDGPPGGPRDLDQQNLHGKLLMELVDCNDLYFTFLHPSIMTAQIQSDFRSRIGAASRCFFQVMPMPPHPLNRLQSGAHLLSETAWPFMHGWMLLILWDSKGHSQCSLKIRTSACSASISA